MRQATHVAGIHRARYPGLPKTRLERNIVAAAINMIRMDAYWTGHPLDTGAGSVAGPSAAPRSARCVPWRVLRAVRGADGDLGAPAAGAQLACRAGYARVLRPGHHDRLVLALPARVQGLLVTLAGSRMAKGEVDGEGGLVISGAGPGLRRGAGSIGLPA
jgi:hypothetical protein